MRLAIGFPRTDAGRTFSRTKLMTRIMGRRSISSEIPNRRAFAPVSMKFRVMYTRFTKMA
jgi:hypothetical protein